jgi:hypothetical protein
MSPQQAGPAARIAECGHGTSANRRYQPNRSQSPLCRCKAPPNFTIPCSGAIAGGMAPDYLSAWPVNWFKCEWKDRRRRRGINQMVFTPTSSAMIKFNCRHFLTAPRRRSLSNYRRHGRPTQELGDRRFSPCRPVLDRADLSPFLQAKVPSWPVPPCATELGSKMVANCSRYSAAPQSAARVEDSRGPANGVAP